jgi:hypothetical protein
MIAILDDGSIRDFVTELENADKAYRSGAEKDDMVVARRGALSALVALLKLAEGVLTAAGVSGARQGELFVPVKALHSAVDDLNHRVPRPRLLRPLSLGSRPPVGLAETMWRGELAAAYELWMRAHRGSGKSKAVLADEVAVKFDLTMRGKSVREYRRLAVSGTDPRLTQRYRDMLGLVEEELPGDELKHAAEAFIKSAKMSEAGK